MIEYLTHVAILFGINLILASSLNIINGYCGLFSLGHAGFFAVGAYTGAASSLFLFPELAASSPYIALLLACVLGMLAAGIVGLGVGIPCLRLTGDYLAIATVGFSEIIRISLLNMDSVGGSRGLPGIMKITNVPTIIVAVVLVLYVLKNFIGSSYGRAIISIREDEIAARSMGVDVRFYKTFAFVLGSSLAGLAGALFGHYAEFLHPSNFQFMVSINILLMIVIGGMGSQVGAALGALIVTLLPALLRLHPAISDKQVLLFGCIMVAVMLSRPDGLVGLFKRKGLVTEL